MQSVHILSHCYSWNVRVAKDLQYIPFEYIYLQYLAYIYGSYPPKAPWAVNKDFFKKQIHNSLQPRKLQLLIQIIGMHVFLSL